MLPNGFLSACGTIWMDFGWIRQDPKLADFEQKAWAIAHAFEHGGFCQVLEIAPNFLKRLLYAWNWFLSVCGPIWMDFVWNLLGQILADFEQKAWAIAHAFEHGGFLQVLEIAPNFLKGLPYACKWISKCLWTYLKGFRVNSQGSEIGRFWVKSLGYSPCFWTWRIWANVGNRSKLSERTPICLQMDF